MRDLITANHILHHYKVVDGYGHISMRNPQNPHTFFMSHSVAPALVSSPTDLVEYNIEDASPVKSVRPFRRLSCSADLGIGRHAPEAKCLSSFLETLQAYFFDVSSEIGKGKLTTKHPLSGRFGRVQRTLHPQRDTEKVSRSEQCRA